MSDAELSLEARLHRLEEIVSALEREDIELDDALALFEEGIAHLRAAQGVLNTAELRIERLIESAAGVRTEQVRGDVGG
jgi:exodeoxyribonuclease VII small subunit